jgi:hypothetical protein
VYKATQVNEAAAGHEDDDNGMALIFGSINVRERFFCCANFNPNDCIQSQLEPWSITKTYAVIAVYLKNVTDAC